MKKFATLSLASCLAISAFAGVADADTTQSDSIKKFVFTDVKTVKTTSVKDQNKSGTCWCFAGTSFFEDEILRQGGDSLDLSEMFTVHHCYNLKGDKYVRLYGQTNFGAGGSLLDVVYVWKSYGAVPEEVYSGLQYGEDKHVHGELDGILYDMLKTVVSKPNGTKISTAWKKAYDGVLNAYLGELPETFTYKGKKIHTPKFRSFTFPSTPEQLPKHSHRSLTTRSTAHSFSKCPITG